MPPLSAIIPACNDLDVYNTVRSLRDTAPESVQVVIIDDASPTPVALQFPLLANDPNIKILRNEARCGVGPSRYIGAIASEGDFLLFLDAHMRFLPGWYEAAMSRIKDRPQTVHCATCLGLDSTAMDPHKPKSVYYGATLNVFGPDPQHPMKNQIMEGNWHKQEPADDAELSCVMGGAYFVARDWFFRLDPLRFLRGWGSDEPQLSIKSWLAGGECRLMKNVRIAHKFLIDGKEKQPYSIRLGFPTWNKLFLIETLLPYALAEKLKSLLHQITTEGREYYAAIELARADNHIIQQEHFYNQTIFTRDFLWLAEKFKLLLPT